MSFVRLSKSPSRRRADTVLVSLESPPSNKHPHFRVRLGTSVAAAAGLSAGDAVGLVWGQHEDAGSILVVREADGPKLRRQSKSHVGVLESQFGGLPLKPLPGRDGAEWTLSFEPRAGVECQWRVIGSAVPLEDGSEVDGGVLVELPRAWWRVSGGAQAVPVRDGEERVAPRVEPAPAPAAPEAPVPPGRLAFSPPRGRDIPQPPAPEDKIEQTIRLIGQGLLDSEIINKVRCTSAFLSDCKRERVRRQKALGSAANGAAAA